MANNVKGIYRFTDKKSGEVFEGTRDEYAEHLKIKERTLDTRIQNRRVAREKIGEIKIKQKKRVQRYTNFKTGQVFEGSRQEACEFFGIKDWKLERMLKDGSIFSSFVVADEIPKDKFELPAPMSKEEKLRRELYRKKCLLKSFNVS